jgi:hypothetical protein
MPADDLAAKAAELSQPQRVALILRLLEAAGPVPATPDSLEWAQLMERRLEQLCDGRVDLTAVAPALELVRAALAERVMAHVVAGVSDDDGRIDRAQLDRRIRASQEASAALLASAKGEPR